MKRNPYLLLGVPYGTRPDVAQHAFGRAADRVRGSTDSAVTVEDLEWALREVQSTERDPLADMTLWRVPADPDVLAPVDTGVLNPAPAPLGRTTGPQDATPLLPDVVHELTEVLDVVITTTTTFDYGYVFHKGRR